MVYGSGKAAQPMIVGIDIGGSTTDAVLLDQPGMAVVTIELTDPVAAAAGALGKMVSECGLRLEQITSVAATGAGARSLPDTLLGRPVVKVDEFTAIGVGGSTLAGKESALVVSLGTGTAIVSVRGKKIEHVGGTGVGGGTLLGLARHLLGVSNIATLEAMAARGDCRESISRSAISPAGRWAICHRPARFEFRQDRQRPLARGQGAGDYQHDRGGRGGAEPEPCARLRSSGYRVDR